MQLQQTITPFLSFKNQAEEAANFYVSIIPNSKIINVLKNQADGAVLTVEFQMGGINFVSLNTGQDWAYTNAVSLAISCDTQQEIDTLWDAFADGGQPIQCGWITDRFGVPWQVVPSVITEYFRSGEPDKTQRMLEAVWSMTKLDIAKIQAAYNGEA